MTQKNWKAAAVQYQQASELLPDETYPKEKTKEIDKNIETEKKLAEEKSKIKVEKHKADSALKIQKQIADTLPPKAKDIVNNYKDKTPKKDTVQKVKNNNPPEGKQGIIFRVQFAMSETEPDINKYKNADDVWYYKAGNVYKITSGSFSTPDEDIKHQEKIRAAGYKDAFVVAFKNNQRIDFKEAVKQIQNK